jgi:tryptophanyl-tRNA synthetase
MSKSYDNAIYLADPPEITVPKIKTMVTDPARKRRTDPGDPEVCPVFDLHRIFTPAAEREQLAEGCRTAGIGCLDCKGALLAHLLPKLGPIRERRAAFAAEPDRLRSILHEGSARARQVAAETLAAAKTAVGIPER